MGQNAQIGALQTVLNSLSISEGIVSVTNTALTDVIGDVENISRDLVSANQTGANLAALQEDISANQQAIISAGNSATFNGVNWLVNDWKETVSTTVQHTFDISQSQMDQTLAQSDGTFEDAVTQTVSVNYTDTQDNETVTANSTASETVDYSLSNSGASIDPSTGGQDDYENYSIASASQSDTERSTIHDERILTDYDPSDGPQFVDVDLSQLNLFDMTTLESSRSDTTNVNIPPSGSWLSIQEPTGNDPNLDPYNAAPLGHNLLTATVAPANSTGSVSSRGSEQPIPTGRFINGVEQYTAPSSTADDAAASASGESYDMLDIDLTSMSSADIAGAALASSAVINRLTGAASTVGALTN